MYDFTDHIIKQTFIFNFVLFCPAEIPVVVSIIYLKYDQIILPILKCQMHLLFNHKLIQFKQQVISCRIEQKEKEKDIGDNFSQSESFDFGWQR